MVLVASLFYKYFKYPKNNIAKNVIALILGSLTMTVVMIAMNLLLTPIFAHTTAKYIWENMMFTFIVPFNLVKSGINSAVVFVIFPIIQKIIKNRA